MPNIDALKTLAKQIRDERGVAANTAARVGNMLLAIIDELANLDPEELKKLFLSRKYDDSAEGYIQFLKGFLSLGDSAFSGNLSSEKFISGFVGGQGWAIIKKSVLNALGIEETKYTGEFDNLVVRGTLKIFELIVSQMLGENDNRIFSAMMEVDHYDGDNDTVYLDTQNGKLYNPFRAGDYILVQQYNGMPSEENDHYVTKHYELIITEVGVGLEGENRLDWVKFKNFTTPIENAGTNLITKGDTFVRVDSETDEERKGIIEIMTVGHSTPYIDIIHGLKTDPDNAVKGRIGNISGIQHPLFGWLQGFGEYLSNLYAVGDFRLRRTGENVDSKIEALKDIFATSMQRVTYELTEEDNFLHNATFMESLEGWSGDNDTTIITSNGEAMLMNGNTYSSSSRVAAIEQYDGKNLLHIKNNQVSQVNDLIRKPGTHKEYIPSNEGSEDTTIEYKEVKDTLYMSVKMLAKTDGVLTIGFQGATTEGESLPLASINVSSSSFWQLFKWEGTWDGLGDFELSYTGDAYISLLSITDKPIEEYKKELHTKIEQTDSNIRITGQNINNIKGTVTDLGIDLDAAKEKITIYADRVDALNGTVTNLGIRLDAAESNISLYAQEVSDNTSAISSLNISVSGISSTVTSVQGDLEAAKATAAAASKAAQDTATQALSDATAAANEALTARNAASSAQSTADSANSNANSAWSYAYDAYQKAVNNATAISQTDSAVSILAGRFTSDGELVNKSGLLTTAFGNNLTTQMNDLDGKLVAKADISTSVQFNPSTGAITSNIKLAADKIEFVGKTIINNKFVVDVDGNVQLTSANFTTCKVTGALYVYGYSGSNSLTINEGSIISYSNTGEHFILEPTWFAMLSGFAQTIFSVQEDSNGRASIYMDIPTSYQSAMPGRLYVDGNGYIKKRI